MAVEIQSLSGYAGNTILCVNPGATGLECVPKSTFVSSVSPAFTGTPTAPTATVGTNTTQIATTAFVVAEIASRLALADALRYKGAIDCSTNPNYPAADAGDTYRVSVAGKIGGASGLNVEAGDLLMCRVDGTVAGTQAAVGANWDAIQTNIDGAVTLTGTQTLTNKTLTSPTISGAITFPDGVRQTFNPDGTNAGINVGAHTADPSAPSNGDLWYNSTSNQLKARINGASVALGAGGSTYNESNPIFDSTSNELLKFVRVASAVNEWSISNNSTGNSPILSLTGGDTNIDGTIAPKGTGGLNLLTSNGSNGLMFDSVNYGSTYRVKMYSNVGSFYIEKTGGQDLIFSGTSFFNLSSNIYTRWSFNSAFKLLANSPTQITANQNDYLSGTQLTKETTPVYRVSADAAREITGLYHGGTGWEGQLIYFVNVGVNSITLKHQSTNSTAAYRFICTTGADIVLAADKIACFWYDITSSRWRVWLM